MWLALDSANQENGCLSVLPTIPDSYLAISEVNSKNSLIKYQIDPSSIAEESAVNLEVSAGDAIILHPRSVHCSGKNISNYWRRAIAIRYIAVETKILWQNLYGCEWDCAFLAAGSPDGNPNSFAPLPKFMRRQHMAFPASAKYI